MDNAAAPICVRRDPKWRQSTFHVVLLDGSAFLDFLESAEGKRQVVACSFDGYGCAGEQLDVPDDLWDELIDGLNEDGASKTLAGVDATHIMSKLRA